MRGLSRRVWMEERSWPSNRSQRALRIVWRLDRPANEGVVWNALRSVDTRMRAIGAIEKRREDPVACPYRCQDWRRRWSSTRTGVQGLRYRSCMRRFSSSTNTSVARIHSPPKFEPSAFQVLRLTCQPLPAFHFLTTHQSGHVTLCGVRVALTTTSCSSRLRRLLPRRARAIWTSQGSSLMRAVSR